MTRFLVDAQLPAALAWWMTERGHLSEHVFDVGLALASDSQIWEYASKKGMVILTKDEDFSFLHAMNEKGPAIVWLRMPNTRRTALLKRFEEILPMVQLSLENGETLIEVR